LTHTSAMPAPTGRSSKCSDTNCESLGRADPPTPGRCRSGVVNGTGVSGGVGPDR
jgi:hypothetical protein